MCTDMRLDRSFLFGNISIQNRDSSIYKKSNCGKTMFTLFTFLCSLFYFTSSCIPCLQALFVLLLFVLFLIYLVPRRMMIVSFFCFFLHFASL